jgi:ubiquinone/menaquinone biosynthesis C-methylase UbiE
MMAGDKWSDWLLHKRFGGDAKAAEAGLAFLKRVRDLVLDKAALREGQTVLDVGAGDGLIAFGALERVGDSGRVIFADVSQALLDHAHSIATDLGVAERCTFVEAPAEALEPIADESVDVVTTRSVLVYVKDKRAAFREFHRVLRPGGRVSIWEPINRFTATYAGRQQSGGAEGVGDLIQRLAEFYRELQPLDSDAMMDFDERDLLRACEEAGFRHVRVDASFFAFPAQPAKWDTVLHSAGNPNVPTLAEAMARIFNETERARYVAAMRPVVETGGGMAHTEMALLVGVKDGGAEVPDLTRG